ncbi:hypothetical protein L3Q82_025310, partial [Scortum barcoo]
FTDRANMSVDDAVNTAQDPVCGLAFNTIILALLQDELSQLNVPDSSCRWVTDFQSERRLSDWWPGAVINLQLNALKTLDMTVDNRQDYSDSDLVWASSSNTRTEER